MRQYLFKQLGLSLFCIIFLSNLLPAQVVIQRCDVTTGWEGTQAFFIDSDDKMEGSGSLKIEAQAGHSLWYSKLFSDTYTGISGTGYLSFWLYLSDASKLGKGQIEISSSDNQDKQTLKWQLSKRDVVNGWNNIQLQISKAKKINGGANLEKINFFQISQTLSDPITVKIDFIRFSPEKNAPVWPLLDVPVVDNSSLDGKVMFGYQGWFNHPDDGAGLGWVHWGELYKPIKLAVDMYPDMREYGSNEKYETHYTLPDGSMAPVFSSHNRYTVYRHMKWVRDYNLDGVFLQRFIRQAQKKDHLINKDTVAVHIMVGCEKYGRVFGIMYDGLENMVEEIKLDWMHLVDDIGVTQSERYLNHHGLPLVTLWGYTVRDGATVDQLVELTDWFTKNPEPKYRATIMLGVKNDWYELNEDWMNALKNVAIISPWFSGDTDYDKGQAWCDANNIDFLPVVHPGFSWYNKSINIRPDHELKEFNAHPRDGGNFLWDEVHHVVSKNAKSVYLAMFDEIDEGTAMYKISENAEMTPVQDQWVTADIDGYKLPSDWYLRLASLTAQVVRGYEDNKTALADFGMPPEGIMTIRITDETNDNGNGTMEFIFPDFPHETTIEISIDGGKTYAYSTPDNVGTFVVPALSEGNYPVFVRHGAETAAVDMGDVYIGSVQKIDDAPFPAQNDRIGWSSDGNLADEDDWSATPMALAIFAKMGWQDKLVHFDYNNRLDRSLEWKEAENYESTIGGAGRFGFNQEVFFDDQRELEAAIENAKEEINKSHEGSKFWYVQAGPFEVAYQALLRANPEKRQYCILVSHSEINEVPGKWKLEDGTPSHGKDDCVAIGAKYFFTSNQYKEKFGGRTYKRWDLVEWMKKSSCDEYKWLHSRFLATAEHKDGGLDASDGGMAFALATGDLNGNFTKLGNFLGSDCKESSTEMQKICIILDADDEIASSKPVLWAVDQLRESLNQHGVKVSTHSAFETAPDSELNIIIAGSKNVLSHKILKASNVSISDAPESLGLVQDNISGKNVLLASGSDTRGLMYAVLELADRIQCGIAPSVALNVSKPIIEKPAIKIRSIYRPFTSEVEDKPWYNDREFWKSYLSELAKQRINRFSLAFGMGYNSPTRCVDSYFFFAYPFLVDVPGYDVRAEGLPDEERDSNMEMLRFISDEAAAHGMEFQLALWSHGYDFPENVNYKISGLSEENHATYCRDALTLVLQTCPSITGVTYRVHKESGIPDGTQDFWEIVFEAHKQAGRHVWIDMHGKSLTQEQLTWALETGMPVSASPKFVGEHMGLGYHPADIRHSEKGKVKDYIEPTSGVHLTARQFTRSGYGDFLPEDREWSVLHRIWPGTNVLLLAGDPSLAAGYGRSTNLLGSMGVERVDPLGFKGRKGSGYPGGRCAYADKSLEPEWDFQKFLYTYRVWGRLLYNPETDPNVWQRFLRSKFGNAAKSMEIALANSSRVVHLITTAHGEATDCTRFWPEMYTNQPIVNESDDAFFNDNPSPKVFGNVSPHDPQLFSKMNDFAAALLEGEELAKYSPLLVAQWLEDMADIATLNLNKAESLVEDKSDVEFRRFYHDIKIQCGIANFFANKMRAAVLWHLYEGSGDTTALVEAVNYYTIAHDAWVKMAEDAKSIYVENVSFGDWVTQSGHWIDRIPRIDSDIADMKELLAEAKGNKSSQQKSVSTAIQRVKSHPQLTIMNCRHTPAKNFQAGKPMKIDLELTQEAKGVDLYYRHVNQAVEWQVLSMDKKGKICRADIPAEYTKTRYPMEYYFAIDMGEAGKAIFPGLDENQANMPYYVIRQFDTEYK